MSRKWPLASTTARTAGAGLATAGVLLTGAIAITPASAQAAFGTCVAIIPAQAQSRDMAHPSGNNGPVISRYSSGISPAESWRLFPISTNVVALINNMLDPTGISVVAAVSDTNQGSKVQVAQIVNPGLDSRQQWKREDNPGWASPTPMSSAASASPTGS